MYVGEAYLILLNPLHSNSIPISLIGCNISIAKLAMTQQFSDRIALVKIFGIPKIGSLPAGYHPAPPRVMFVFVIKLLGIPIMPMGLIPPVLALMPRRFLCVCYDFRRRRLCT